MALQTSKSSFFPERRREKSGGEKRPTRGKPTLGGQLRVVGYIVKNSKVEKSKGMAGNRYKVKGLRTSKFQLVWHGARSHEPVAVLPIHQPIPPPPPTPRNSSSLGGFQNNHIPIKQIPYDRVVGGGGHQTIQSAMEQLAGRGSLHLGPRRVSICTGGGVLRGI